MGLDQKMFAGKQSLTLLDYPGELAMLLFTTGCNMNCSYCHNSELIKFDNENLLYTGEEILKELRERKGKLTAISISGGEPTLHLHKPHYIKFLEEVKELGYKIKIDTNGSVPLQNILKMGIIDYIAMDIKGSSRNFREVAGIKNNPNILDVVDNNIKLIMNNGIDYEFKTTIEKDKFTKDDFIEIGEKIKGAKVYFLQKCQRYCISPTDGELEGFRDILVNYVENTKIR